MVKTLKRKVKHWVESPHMLAGIGAASFAESTVVPIPIETVLIPVSQLRRDKIWQIAAVATGGCILGALLGYAIGLWVFALFEPQIIGLFGDQATFDDIMLRMNNEGFWFIVLAGIAPIPLQLAMVAAGASGYPLGWYILAIAISRVLRYFGIAWLVWRFGDQAEAMLRRYKWKAVAILSGAIVLIWLGRTYLFN